MTVLNQSMSPNQNVGGHLSSDDLIHRLCSSVPASAPGAVVALLQVVISFGLVPLILWPMRWAALVDVERDDLLELISRWRSRVAPKDARKLDRIARRLRPRPMLMVLPWLVAGFTGALMIALVFQGESFSSIWTLTFDHDRHYRDSSVWVPTDSGMTRIAVEQYGMTDRINGDEFRWQIQSHLFRVWLWGLLLAYSIHWFAVRSHVRSVNSLAKWTNRLAAANGLPQVNNDSMQSGLGLVWVILAIGLCLSNAWWGIPLVLVGAMQKQYSRWGSIRLRTALGNQLRDGLPVSSPGTATMRRVCGGAHCGSSLPSAANFCPRCGSAAVSRL